MLFEIYMCQNTGFLWPVYSRIRTGSTILSLYGNERVKQNPCYDILRSVKSSFHEELKSLRYNLGLVIEAVIRWTSTGELAELALDSLEKMRLFRELIYLI